LAAFRIGILLVYIVSTTGGLLSSENRSVFWWLWCARPIWNRTVEVGFKNLGF